MMTQVQSVSVTDVRTKSAQPFCITYDFESVDDGCVTVRDRDTMQQERVSIDKLSEYIAEKVKF